MMSAIKKAFDLMEDDFVELSTENEALKNNIGSSVEKSLEESTAKRANLITSWMEEQMKEQEIFINK